MTFTPHTDEQIKEMLDVIGVSELEDLFDEIPKELRIDGGDKVLPPLNEFEVVQELRSKAAQDKPLKCFIGGGAYEHYIPAAIWDIALRGEFYTAYTPYQAEASQGTLQVLYEYQTAMTRLMSMDVSNASLYDGATALAESILMAVRANRKVKSGVVLIPRTINPLYRKVIDTIVVKQGIAVKDIPFDVETGKVSKDELNKFAGEKVAALVIPQPNYFGVLEDVDYLSDWAKDNGALSIAVVNPLLMSVLTPPGDWGEGGADIACGDGQPLGIPLSSGGPYFGFICCKQKHVRQLPGRIIGRTEGANGETGYVLTLQAREQHIRRSKATSNICTNQGLMVTASTIYMSLLGDKGMRSVSMKCLDNTNLFLDKLSAEQGICPLFTSPGFNEVVVKVDGSVQNILCGMEQDGIAAGVDLSSDFPELGNAMLVCLTETKTDQDIELYFSCLSKHLRKAA